MNQNLNSIKIIAVLLFLFSKSPAQQWGDYTLYSTQNSTNAYLIDTITSTTAYHTWTFPTTAKTGYSTYLLPGGTLLRTVARSGNSFSGGPICGQVQKVDYNNNVIWDFVYSTTQYCTHHDICPMPNGNVLLISYELKTAAEIVQAGCTASLTSMWPDKIVEVQPTGATTGTVVWEWHAWDHLVQNVNAAKDNYQTSIVDHPELLNINFSPQKDWMHMNGVDYNPILDQIAFSSHNLSEWYIIDHSTTTAEAASHTGGNSGKGGDLLYRWGHPAVYGATGTQILNVTHDAHWIPEGSPNAGRLVGFNNKGVSSSQSSIDQVITPINGYNYDLTAGAAYAPSTYTSRLACNGYSSNMGNSQQLPNGNMLVCVATSGLIYETDPNGTTIWSKQLSGSVAQSFRYENCYITNTAPPIPEISANGNVLTSTLGDTYQWYMNGVLLSGETNQDYTATQDGIYLVRTTDVNNCGYSYSTGVKFTLATGVIEFNEKNTLNIFPNPGNGIINISGSKSSLSNVIVRNAIGKVVYQNDKAENIDISNNPSGIYYVSISSSKENIVKKYSLIK